MVIESIMMGGNYDAMSFSSKDNVYELIWYYDVVVAAANKGNENAAIVIFDLDRLLDSKYKCRCMDRVRDCISIQMGEVDIARHNPDSNLIELLAELRGESLISSEEELEKDVDEIVRLSNYYWKKSLRYRRSRGFSRTSVGCSEDSSECESYWELDKKLKRREPVQEYDGEKPESLKSLEEVYDKVSEALTRLGDMPSRTREQQDEMNKLIRYKISVSNDIQLVKDSYGIPYSTNQASPSRDNSTILSYVSSMHDIEFIAKYDDESSLASEWQANRIRFMCQDILTARQYMYFMMYYVEGYTQGRIGGLLGRDRSAITKGLASSIDRIRGELGIVEKQ